MKKLQRKLWAVLMVVVFLVGALVAIVPRASATPSMSTLLKPSLDSMIVPTARAGTPSVDSAMMRHASDAAEPHPNWEKLSSSLQEAALAGTGTLNTAILTDDVAQLGGYLRAHGVDTKIGSVPTTITGFRVVTIELPAKMLEKVASLDHVYAMAPAVIPEAPARADPELPSVTAMNGPAPTIIEAGKGHHVPEAWALGYTGYGVRVSVMDSGVDFGHPDLQGTYAREEDLASPYYNWPMAFDPSSMALYLLLGVTFPAAPSSWYVDTSFVAGADPASGWLDSEFNGHVYNVYGIPSASGSYHLGIHPDNQLPAFWWGEYVGVLVTDSLLPGVYDTVYVDLNDNYNFTDDKAVTMASPESWADYYDAGSDTWDFSSWTAGDGLADFSGGLVYWMADGSNPIPYSDVIADRYGLPLPMPSSGDLVAFMIGDVFSPGGDHGTLCASSIVAQNVTGAVEGFAPQAKLIAVGNIYAGGFPYDIYTFVAEGYDGISGTGDEAMVASASFGYSTVFNDGWDFEARWVELHADFLYPLTAYVVSSGNGGHGFGTVTSPGSSNGVITVGASTSYNAALGDFDLAAHSTFGDVQPWSNRGPSAVGMTKPDLVTVGAWASGDGALNEFGGAPPWYTWGGTSLSAPATAGIYALAANAWQNATLGPLVNYIGKWILTGSADNIHYDPQAMGHGLANALRAVEAASFTDGVIAFDEFGSFPYPQWGAGDYRGTQYGSFSRLMSPGQTATEVFDVYNLNSISTKDVQIYDWELDRTGSDTWTISANLSQESPADFLRPDYLIDLTGLVPAGTNLVKATVNYPLSELDPDGDYNGNSRWRLVIYDWLDYNSNGVYWNDTDGNGVVNAGEMDESSGMEIQRFTVSYVVGTTLEASVHDPLSRIHDGLLLALQHRPGVTLVPITNLTVTVEYYQAVDAPWLSVDVMSATIPTGCGFPPCFIPVTLNVTLPSDQPFGALSGVVSIVNGTTETQIPVIVNVAASGTDFTFGGDPTSTAFLDNNRMFGGFDWTWRAESGDWRFFYTDIPDSTVIAPGTSLLVHTWWSDPSTDIDTLVFGPTSDPFSSMAPFFWGDYSLDTVGSSANTLISAGRWAFQTATGGPEEWVAAPLSTGLHEIALHNVLNGGVGPSDLFSGQVGTFSVSPTPWDVVTTEPTDVGTFNVSSSLDLTGLDVRAFGVAAPQFSSGLPIENLGQYVDFFSASDIGLIDIWIDESYSQGMDIDLYLFWFDGVDFVIVASSATSAAFERVRLTMPADGDYAILVDGYSVPAGTGEFDLYKAVIAGTNLTPLDAPTGPIPGGTPVSFNVSYNVTGVYAGFYLGIVFVGPVGAPAIEIDATFTLIDDKSPSILATDPADGQYLNNKSPTFNVTFVDPQISSGVFASPLILDGLIPLSPFDATDTGASYKLPLDLSDGWHDAFMYITDGVGYSDSVSWSFYIDSSAPDLVVTDPSYTLTQDPSATVSGTTEPGANVTVNGVPATVDGTGAFTEVVTLAEGLNTIEVVATDAAGNFASVTKSVTLDTTPPALTVDEPTAGSLIGESVVTVSGTTEAGASVAVNGVAVAVDSSGDWSADLALSDGAQTITATATDAAGNHATVTRSVTVDTTAPGITLTAPAEPLTNSDSVVVSGIVSDPGASVTVNGNAATVNPTTGAFTTTLTLADGVQTITVVATDDAGNEGTATAIITVDTAAPSVTVSAPADGFDTDTSTVVVSGTVDDPTATVLVNGQAIHPSATGAWSAMIALAEGDNAITVSAIDPAGNVASSVSRTVTYTSPVPGINQAISSTNNSLIYGLVAAFVVLAAVAFVLYWNLSKRIRAVEGSKPEEKEPL
ncbi:MAG TPA: Ig-like domain-containing protein [Thermoplasmata archaeon]|jgi:hypothetical protein